MAWSPGESGNPEGSRKHKAFAAALHRAMTQEDGKRLREAAEQLLTQAAAGEQWAIRELADRLDGKPAQATIISGDEERPLITKVVREIVRPHHSDG